MWGLWGEWELWKCNPAKACMKTRRRKCNNPAPIRGGKNCADSGGQPVQSAGKVYKSTSRIHAFLVTNTTSPWNDTWILFFD